MTSATSERTRGPDGRDAATRRSRRALCLWLGLVAVGLLWGRLEVADDPRQALGAAPLAGRWAWHGTLGLLPAIGVGVLVATRGPAVTAKLRWRHVPVLAGAAATTWAVLLAASDGWSRLASPLASRYEYVPFVPSVGEPSSFLRTFTDRALEYPTHVRGHPPGATLAFWALDWIGLPGTGWAAALVVVAWGAAVAISVWTVGHVAGRDVARGAAPFLVLLPAAVWAATSADALFAAVAAAAVALLAVASGRQGVVLGVLGGAVFALALHMTYGAAPLLAVPAVVVAWRRRFDVVVPAAAGGAIVVALWAAAGFWWLDGLEVTRTAYWAGVASHRPWPYFVLAGNPAALALATGPAVAVAAVRARRSKPEPWLLAVGAAVAVAVANSSLLSKGEVERIWLLFVPWVATAAALVPRVEQRKWLLVQVATAVVLQASLRSPW